MKIKLNQEFVESESFDSWCFFFMLLALCIFIIIIMVYPFIIPYFIGSVILSMIGIFF